MTVDIDRSNSIAYTALIGEFQPHGHFLFYGGEFLHVRCVAHKHNLVEWDWLKVVGKSVKWIRAAMRFIRQSLSRSQRLKNG